MSTAGNLNIGFANPIWNPPSLDLQFVYQQETYGLFSNPNFEIHDIIDYNGNVFFRKLNYIGLTQQSLQLSITGTAENFSSTTQNLYLYLLRASDSSVQTISTVALPPGVERLPWMPGAYDASFTQLNISETFNISPGDKLYLSRNISNTTLQITFSQISYTFSEAIPSSPEIVYSQSAQFNSSQIAILDTTPGSITSGALIVSGGITAKDSYIGGHLAINDVKVTPNLEDVIFEKQVTLNNDVSTFTNITGFNFDSTKTSSFKAQINVTVSDSVNKYALYEINGLYIGTEWVLTSWFNGQITNVSFGITSGGQMQYKNTNSTGTTTIRLRAITNGALNTSPF